MLFKGKPEAVKVSELLAEMTPRGWNGRDMLWGYSVNQIGSNDNFKITKKRCQTYNFKPGTGGEVESMLHFKFKNARWVFVFEANDEKKRLQPVGVSLCGWKRMKFGQAKYVEL